jgi:hypothetical protein
LTRLTRLWLVVLLTGCRASVPDAWFACTTDDDCPPNQQCIASLCRSEPIDAGTSLQRDAGMTVRDAGEPDSDGGIDGGMVTDSGTDGGTPIDGGDATTHDGGPADCAPACEAPAFCDTSAAPRCRCAEPGFEDPPAGGTRCVDVDECGRGLDECAATATCSNSIGSYECECSCGYRGDGRTCDLSQAFYGQRAPLSMLSASSGNYVTGSRITLDRDAHVLSFRVYSRSSGAQIVMALYSHVDDGAGGHPGTLVLRSRAMPLAAGEVVGSPEAPCVLLPAGTYWLMTLGDRDFDVGSDGATTERIAYAPRAYASGPLPVFATPVMTYAGARMNLYIETD